MEIREILAKSILSKSQIYQYALNPYVGCQHDCQYCYAKYMRRFTGHEERWGDFVDVKINAPELLAQEVKRKKPGRVWISGVCDPYQPLEEKYMLTRDCLSILVENGWAFTIQTKSALVLRDMMTLVRSKDVEVGFTITTADEKIRNIFEPCAPPISTRLAALTDLHSKQIRTFAMIAPILPGAENLVNALKDKVDYVLLDRVNYHYADHTYKSHGLQWASEHSFFSVKGKELLMAFERSGMLCQKLF
ncbi:MAG TPA: radical SAM protein [Nitrospirota bacterium]|nr:radical SAM protein [Nitrospirota bacterium]